MRVLAALLLLWACACSSEQTLAPVFHDEAPETLSAWGVIAVTNNRLTVADAVTPYDLATPLFSDYALKLRTVWLPEGQAAAYEEWNAFDFPVGTVLTKTFYYPKNGHDIAIGAGPSLTEKSISLNRYQLIETRLLVRRQEGWAAFPYIWNEAQTDALLKRTGAIKPLRLVDGAHVREIDYLVPDQNQCAACHAVNATTKRIEPIGLKARHLNKPSSYSPGFNQLDHWIASGMLAAPESSAAPTPANAAWNDEAAPIEERARAYLDINCSHCHNPQGTADTSGLNLEPDAQGPALGLCKSPIAAGGGTGGRRFSIVPGDPEESILLFRMETMDPAAMMPELGRALAHEEGVTLIRNWIAEMNGRCG